MHRKILKKNVMHIYVAYLGLNRDPNQVNCILPFI